MDFTMNGIRLIFLLALCLVFVLRCSAKEKYCRHHDDLEKCKICCNLPEEVSLDRIHIYKGSCACRLTDQDKIDQEGTYYPWDVDQTEPGECLKYTDGDKCQICCNRPKNIALTFTPGVYGKSSKKCLCSATDMQLHGEPEEPESVQETSGSSDEENTSLLSELEKTETPKREQAEADKRAKIEANKPQIIKVKFNEAFETIPEGDESDEASEGIVLPPKPIKQDRRDNMPRMASIITIREKLEAIYMNDTTDLKVEELVEANSQYQSLTENAKNGLRSMPRFRLVIDFALAPMQLDNPPPLSLILEQYRVIRRAYVLGWAHKEVDPRDVLGGSLVWALYKKIGSVTHKPVEYSEFEAAKNESLAKLERMNELTEKNLIYENLQEFAKLTTYFNAAMLKPFFIHIFPAMKTVKNVEILEWMYFQYIPRYGWEVPITGGWSKSKLKESKEPGFMYVI